MSVSKEKQDASEYDSLLYDTSKIHTPVPRTVQVQRFSNEKA